MINMLFASVFNECLKYFNLFSNNTMGMVDR